MQHQSGLWLKKGLGLAACVFLLSGCFKNDRDQSAVVSEEMQMKRPQHHAAAANVDLGLGYLSQGQVSRAKKKLVQALKLAPELSEPHLAMAYFYERSGDFQDAEKEHQRAIEIQASGGAYNNYGAFLCRRQRYQEADAAFGHALEDKLYSRTADVYENRGVCAMRAGDKLAAERYLGRSLQQDEKRVTAALELANLYIERQSLHEAQNLLNHYDTLAEPTARSVFLKFKVADALHRPDLASRQAALLQSLFQDSPEYQGYQDLIKASNSNKILKQDNDMHRDLTSVKNLKAESKELPANLKTEIKQAKQH